jgi:hypothetical protein
VLNLFSTNFLLELLGPKSPIEHLLIGGDTFPTELVLRYANNCSAKIYNVYGVTEVSCWASCTQFRPFSDVVADASNAISDTRLIFAPDGVEIYGRTCVVNGERKSGVQTGDQFICVTSNEKKAYVITSRVSNSYFNNIAKFLGKNQRNSCSTRSREFYISKFWIY